MNESQQSKTEKTMFSYRVGDGTENVDGIQEADLKNNEEWIFLAKGSGISALSVIPDTEDGLLELCCRTENQIQADGTIRDVEYDGSHGQFLVRTSSKLSVVNLFPIEGKDRIVGYDIPSTTKTAGYLFSYATIGGSNGISALVESTKTITRD